MTSAPEPAAPGPARLAYLGPEGTFTHAAALALGERGTPEPLATVTEVYDAVASGFASTGVVAIESSVEGYVVPSLDAIVAARDVVAVDEVALDISFDAFTHPDATELTEVCAHPHGLAQCAAWIAERGLKPVPASSNAAACRDVEPHQVALGPSLCGDLYGLRTLATAVQDFAGGRTRFLALTRRDVAQAELAAARGAGAVGSWRTMLAITPHVTGPGVLARITAAFGERGVNMSSLITRPLKAQEGTYVFVVTLDGAPWEPHVRTLLEQLLEAGDSLKTLGVFPDRTSSDAVFDDSRVPVASVQRGASPDEAARGLLW
ncbi:prephenate dehydratase [Flavimobilis soli]|uniref:Prephenate dehydratase n=1 Tax=Flavimobilis soli TaxID=442709 RepID=A0A2A9EC93_9MICO|nr:prephenate dehydratase domain-containing protein [Flavimobilis soli]PFG36161.1 prephenate dehydratase [Flavimobilis soli]